MNSIDFLFAISKAMGCEGELVFQNGEVSFNFNSSSSSSSSSSSNSSKSVKQMTDEELERAASDLERKEAIAELEGGKGISGTEESYLYLLHREQERRRQIECERLDHEISRLEWERLKA